MDIAFVGITLAITSVLWFLASVAVGYAAGKRGQSPWLWLIISIVTTPFLGALLLFAFTRPPQPGTPA